MEQRPNVLDYAGAAATPSIKRWITPRALACLGGAVAALTWLAPLDVGSGRFILNPVRLVGCGVAVLCALGYAFLRLWQDRGNGAARALGFGACLVVSVAAFVRAHHSVWGDIRLPRVSLRNVFWQSLALSGGAILFAIAWAFAWRTAARRRGSAGRRSYDP